MNVFVYGTLKAGHGNHRLLETSKFLGEATTLPRYRLYDCGHFPCLVDAGTDGCAIQGEVYEVDYEVLTDLDRLEGVPRHYQRKEIKLAGFPVRAVAYFYQGDVSRFARLGSSWPAEPPDEAFASPEDPRWGAGGRSGATNPQPG